ncbi:hypothetical protein CALVIDRAFT_597958 [Calocera viscosa TUFC12733]|uniref:Protein CPL1-like domain-containing protein n=1 Tax=Calocera viscosa (strain TUFC12733) TaxID=1330018 RepID=A0A167MKH0_CALVF|nr:hypothetical protein CALVIDRAFT_597958 [Calocera viscosa TUFC12733]
MYSLRLSVLLAIVALSLPAQATPLGRPTHKQQGSLSRVDTCANVDQGMLTDGRTEYGAVTGCLCHSTLSRFALLSPAVRRATRILGAEPANSLLEALIASDASARSCEYPPHSLASCAKEDVCGWVCEAGYDLCEGACVPSGNCGSQTDVDAAAVPEESESLPGLVFPPQHKCAQGYIACPAPAPRVQPQQLRRTFPFLTAHSNPLNPHAKPNSNSNSGSAPDHRRPAQPDPAFICVDPQSDAEHCGGCTFSASSPTSFGTFTGSDCSNVRGAVNASCHMGRCVVEKCKHGWDLNGKGGCTRRYNLSKGQVRLGKVRP